MMQKNIILDITKTKEGYTATSPNVDGLVAFSKNFEEVIVIAKDLASKLLSLQNKKNKKQSIFYPEKIFFPTTITV